MTFSNILIILGSLLILLALVWASIVKIKIGKDIDFVRLFLFTIIVFTLGYTLAFYLVMTSMFSKQEITEAHGSFDERLNILDERVSVIEDATKSGSLRQLR